MVWINGVKHWKIFFRNQIMCRTKSDFFVPIHQISSNCDETLFDKFRFRACTFCLDFVCIHWTHQNVRRLKRTDLGGHFCRLKAIRFRGRLSQWVEAEFYPPAFSRDFSLEFQIVTFRNCTKKILWKHRCMKIKCSFRNYLNPFCAFAKTGAAYSFFFLSY